MPKTRLSRIFVRMAVPSVREKFVTQLRDLGYFPCVGTGDDRDAQQSLMLACDAALITDEEIDAIADAKETGLRVFNTIESMSVIPTRQFIPTGDPRFHALLKEIGELHSRKSHDYGSNKDSLANLRSSESYGVPAWVGAAIREHDKTLRVQSFLEKGCLLNESIEDAWLDKATYSLIALILYREYRDAKEKSTGDAPGPQ